MEHIQEIMIQGIGYSVSANEKIRRADSPQWLLSKRSMFSAKCQPEEHSYTIGISIYEYEFKANEKLL
jgi:hypothetical protein